MFNSVRIVLVNTSHPGNIGAVARAMKNMGFNDLCLVAPKDYPSEVAFARSSGAHDVLNRAKVVNSLDEAIKDCHLVFGASARSRKIVWPIMNPRDCAQQIESLFKRINTEKPHSAQSMAENDGSSQNKVALIFGRENNGLSNEELQRCHYHVHIPSVAEFSSLNLAMAVQVLLYELRMTHLLSEESKTAEVTRKVMSPDDEGWDEPLASVDEVEKMLMHMETAMISTGFHDPDNPRQLMSRMRRLIQRARLDKMEMNILRGFFSAIIKSANKES